VIDAENHPQYRRVTLGPLHEGLRIVRDGVGPDDRVVVAGLQRIRPGIVVAPEERPADAAPVPATVGG
jgi:multidrug efflux pump subunit AcrA (membrane-fusion protein)